MSRPWMGYLAGTAFVLSMAGAATAFAQSAQQAQDQATADSHASQIVQFDRDQDRADLRKQVESQREEARAQRDQARAQRDQARAQQHEQFEKQIVLRHGEDAAQRLRTMLQLKSGQEAALQAYVAAIQPVHNHEQVVIMSGHGEPRTTTQKLADMEQRLTEQETQAKARIEATRKFYGQLDPSQKKVFDEMPLPGPMMIMPGIGPMRVMVNMEGLPHMDRMPPLPPLPPVPPAPPAPPRLDD